MNGHTPDKDTQGCVLVTGGAGYIGSHAVLALLESGRRVVVLDDLSTGRKESVPSPVPLVVGDVGDRGVLREVISRYRVQSVMHFAGSAVVPESLADPFLYYRNNTMNTLVLAETCRELGVDRLIFSSTAAVYGEPKVVPVDEESPTEPINPYGRSKLAAERILLDGAAAYGLRPVILRYFNVAGADPQGRTGQRTPYATHLIKVACETAVGLRDHMEIYGEDYPTADGTCVRDFIHVTDLVRAHVLALEHLDAGGEPLLLNCGYGRGYSVREVVDAVSELTEVPLTVRAAARREGDPARVIAAADRIRERLGWVPEHDDLSVIVGTSLAWERQLAATRELATG